jgi:hypothetical protein
VLAERRAIDDGPQAPADQALDLERAPALLAFARLALGPRVSRARQHAVLGRDPTLLLTFQERRHFRFDRRRAQHAGIAELRENRAFRMAREIRREAHVAHLFGTASTRPHAMSSVHDELRSLAARAPRPRGRPPDERQPACQRTAAALVLSL